MTYHNYTVNIRGSLDQCHNVTLKMANAELFNRRRFIFFFDSRGQFLEDELNHINIEKKPVEPWMFKSATIRDLVHEAINYGRHRPFDLMFIVGGICDITVKNWNTNTISFNWKDSDTLTQHIIKIIEHEEKRFKKELPASKLIFCRIVGADLEKVLRKKSDCDQHILNESIYEINNYIHKKNIIGNMWAPDMATPVHRQIRGENKSCYNHLSNDGLHLSQDLRKKWAKKILSVTDRY